MTLGVLGGGQLGRMFAHAAQSMGFRTWVLDPDPESPAGVIAHHHCVAGFDDEAALASMAQACDAITTEFENVPAAALERLSAGRPVSPSAAAVAVCQHRALEKARFLACGVPCVPHARVESAADVAAVGEELFPAILKTAMLGYDGTGQIRVERKSDLLAAWTGLRQVPCVVEQRVALAAELSVVVARDRSGRCVHLPVQQNWHRDGILAVTMVPAPDIPASVAAAAVDRAATLAQALDYVGVLCVEFFLLSDGRLLANEMAPRPHNSGHYSIDACDLSQFDLQVRVLAGLPLVTPRQHSAAVMLNLLGDLWWASGPEPTEPAWPRVLELPGVHLHLYGKRESRRARKMGHLTVTAVDLKTAREVALQAAGRLGLPGF